MINLYIHDNVWKIQLETMYRKLENHQKTKSGIQNGTKIGGIV